MHERAIAFGAGLVIFMAVSAPSLMGLSAATERPDLTDLNRSLENLYGEGDYEKAIPIGEQLLALEEYGSSRNDLAFASLLLRLAALYRATKNSEKAEAIYKRVVAISEMNLGPKHPMLGAALERYSCFLRREGNRADAYGVQRRALAILAPLPDGVRSGPVTGTVVVGQRVSVPQPKYPAQAKQQRIGGSISVAVLVDETGRPLTACADSGDELLAVASEDAAFRARWTPTTVDKIPVRVNDSVIYNFIPK